MTKKITLSDLLAKEYPELTKVGEPYVNKKDEESDDDSSQILILRPGIVHRLDKDTSGLMVVARTHAAQLSLVNQLKDHSVSRQYLAITTRPPVPSSGTVNQPIGRDPRNRLRMAICLSGKPSITHYQTRASSPNGAALVDCALETGRTHQIRVHMASLKAPLVSDVLYGAPPNPLISRQALHALNLAFLHPVSGAMQTFKSSLPEDLMQTASCCSTHCAISS